MQFQQLFLWRYKTRRYLDKLISAVVIFLSCCYLYGSIIEPNWIEVATIELPLPQLARSFDGFKIVQISDLHVSKYMSEQRLERIIELVNRQQPDAIVITGDLVTKYNYFDAEKLKSKFSLLRSRSATLSVFGNHDHWGENIELLKQTLADSNIIHLENQIHIIERGADKLVFAGLDDPYWGNPDLPKIIAHLPDASTAILLVHEPDYIERSAKTREFALQLSGHSHGGQIKLPFLEPPVLPRGAKKYYGGLSRVEDTIIYTNRGLGMTALPYRFGSRPEITVFTLYRAA